MLKQPDLHSVLLPIFARAEVAINEIEVSLKLDLNTQEEAKRQTEEAIAKAQRKAAKSMCLQKAKAVRVQEIQKEMAEIAGVGGTIHDPVSDSYHFLLLIATPAFTVFLCL